MRIAIFTEGYYPEISGVTTSLAMRVKYLAQWGHTLRIYAPDYSPLAHMYPNYLEYVGEIMPEVTVVPFPSKPFTVDYTRDAATFVFSRLEKDVLEFRPDIIHAECPERLTFGALQVPGIKAARKLKAPTSAIYHTNYLAYTEDYSQEEPWLRLPGMLRGLQRFIVWVYNNYNLTFVPTPKTHDYLQSNGVRNLKVGRYYGVDTRQFHPCQSQDGLPEPYQPYADKVRILYVGRLTADKGIRTLLKSFDLLREKQPGCIFFLIGGGPEWKFAQAWADSHGDGVLLGRVPYDEMGAYFAGASLLVSASAKENRPLSVMEAMASGLPVVAIGTGGLLDLIENGKTGLLVPPDDPAALASAMEKLVRDPVYRLSIARDAHQSMQDQTWEEATRLMLDTWEQLRAKNGKSN